MTGPALAALAAAISCNIPSDRAAELLVAYRNEVRTEAAQEQRAEASSVCLIEPVEANALFRAADLIDPKNACPLP